MRAHTHSQEAGHTPKVLLNPIIFQSGPLPALVICGSESRPSHDRFSFFFSFLGGGGVSVFVSVIVTRSKYPLELRVSLIPPSVQSFVSFLSVNDEGFNSS